MAKGKKTKRILSKGKRIILSDGYPFTQHMAEKLEQQKRGPVQMFPFAPARASLNRDY